MIARYFKYSLSFVLISIVLFSCHSKPPVTYRVEQIDTVVKPTKVSILKLTQKYKKYQGQYIETTGRFHAAFEEFAIYTNLNALIGQSGFWLSPDDDLHIGADEITKMIGKRITIKGMVDTIEKAHLSAYLATITHIYFWQVH